MLLPVLLSQCFVIIIISPFCSAAAGLLKSLDGNRALSQPVAPVSSLTLAIDAHVHL